MMNVVPLLLFGLALVPPLRGEEYVAGTPGGPWSHEELLIVRAKLWKLFTNNWVYKLEEEFPSQGLPLPDLENDLGFFPAKVLRLRF